MTSLGTFIEIFLQALIAGILIGAIYGLMCVGLGIIFGVMRVINFAQGEFLMLGMYFTFYLVVGFNMLSFLGPVVGPYTGALLAGPALFAVGYVLHRFLISRVTGVSVAGTEGEGHYAQLILTLGLALVLQNGGLILFGSTPQSVRTPLSAHAWEIPLLYDANASLFLNQARAVAGVVSVVVAVALYWLINRSRLGKTLRAAADNAAAAIYMGIDVDRAYRIAFGIGIGITAIAGGLVATYNPFQPRLRVGNLHQHSRRFTADAEVRRDGNRRQQAADRRQRRAFRRSGAAQGRRRRRARRRPHHRRELEQ
jgi:branched-chain amino acid transport system permease protein